MIYAPHILQKKVSRPIQNDEYGKPIFSEDGNWVDVCRCRCDDNTTQEFKTENGHVYRPKYHVVCEPNSIKTGDEVRCVNGCMSRGQGKVFMVKSCNYLKYTEIYI